MNFVFSSCLYEPWYRSLAQLSMKFILIINGKILTFISMTNKHLIDLKQETFHLSVFNFYEQLSLRHLLS